jgi:small subunit ribosomal protein S21
MAHVEIRGNESPESLLRRFRKTVSKSGSLSVIREKRWHVPKSEQKRLEKKRAIRRARRQFSPSTSTNPTNSSNSSNSSNNNYSR